MTPTPTVTAVLVAYGDMPLISESVAHLLDSNDVDLRVIVVDNGAAAGALDGIMALDRVEVIDGGGNQGFGGGCNIGAGRADTTYLAFVNPDVLVERDALARLVDAASQPGCGIASASVRLLDEPDLLNSSGGAIHFLGLGWAEGYREPVETARVDREVMAASGAAMVIPRALFVEVGGFTEELFLYHEDAELSLRCRLHGWSILYVAEAVARHAYEWDRNPGKLRLLERNRLVLVLTCYSYRMLLLLGPALVAYEMGMAALAVAQGWGSEKVAGWSWLVRHGRWLWRQRRRVQASRVVPDRDLVPFFSPRFTGAQVPLPRVLAPADAMLGAYWKAVSRWL